MSNIWNGKKRWYIIKKIKNQIILVVIEHSRIIYDVISNLGAYYTLWEEDYEFNKRKLEQKRIKMQFLEEDADEIKIRLIQKYSEVGTHGLGGFLALILRMDDMINPILEFVDIIAYLNYNIDDEVKKRYKKLINYLLEMVDLLKITIKNLLYNPKEVFNNTTQIHEIENVIDVIFLEFLNYLYDNPDIQIRTVLKIRDSIIVLEKLSNQIHDIADSIRVLLYQ